MTQKNFEALREARPKGRVRPLAAGDIEAVARMFMRTFRKSEGAAPRRLIDDLARVYLGYPRLTDELSSLVWERGDGTVGGFMGCTPAFFRQGDALLSGTLAGTWMVDESRPDPEAGTRLTFAQVRRKQDFYYSDTANAISVEISTRVGMVYSPSHSLEWVHPISHAAYAASVASRRLAGRESSGVIAAAARGDDIVRRLFRRPFARAPEGWTHEPVEPQDFARRLIAFVKPFRFRPDWSEEDVMWLIDTAARRPSLGPLRLRVVRDEKGRAAGAFALHARPRGQAVCVQVFGEPLQIGGVLAALIADAAEQGCYLARGAVQPFLMEGFFRLPGTFFRQSCGTLFRSRIEGLPALALGIDGFLGGLAGEKWSPFVSETYG